MEDEFKKYCADYFRRLQGGNNIRTNSDTSQARNENIASHNNSRRFVIVGNKIRSEGSDIASNPQLDVAMIKAYSTVPTPATKELDGEYHFLMHLKSGIYQPSRYFLMPGNGGLVNYSCQLGSRVDWDTVVAAGHTHPLYKDKPSVNRLNKYFSGGDPAIVIIKEIPLFLRTPKAKEIKVLEVRDGWVTTRVVQIDRQNKPTKWKSRG